MNTGQVRKRDGERCARCGSTYNLHVHHRRMRSQGGKNTFPNLVTLCWVCHDWVHHHPFSAQEEGWLIEAGRVPEEVAVLHMAWGVKVLLTEDGTVSFGGA